MPIEQPAQKRMIYSRTLFSPLSALIQCIAGESRVYWAPLIALAESPFDARRVMNSSQRVGAR